MAAEMKPQNKPTIFTSQCTVKQSFGDFWNGFLASSMPQRSGFYVVSSTQPSGHIVLSDYILLVQYRVLNSYYLLNIKALEQIQEHDEVLHFFQKKDRSRG